VKADPAFSENSSLRANRHFGRGVFNFVALSEKQFQFITTSSLLNTATKNTGRRRCIVTQSDIARCCPASEFAGGRGLRIQVPGRTGGDSSSAGLASGFLFLAVVSGQRRNGF